MSNNRNTFVYIEDGYLCLESEIQKYDTVEGMKIAVWIDTKKEIYKINTETWLFEEVVLPSN